MPTKAPNNRIFGLDVMRSLAIVGVLGSHIFYVLPNLKGGVTPLLRLGGVMGVELFFVLSGFLIGGILMRMFINESFSIKSIGYFLVRRWFRTLPNYYLILLINVVLVFFIGREPPDTLFLYFLLLQNFQDGMDIFFTESWSLPIEEFAYVVGPVLLYLSMLLFRKTGRERLFLIATLSIITFFFLSKLYYHYTTSVLSLEQWNIDLKAVVLYRIDSIYYGVLAAYLSTNFMELWKKYRVILAVTGVVGYFGFQIVLGTFNLDIINYSFVWNVLYLPLTSIFFCLLLPIFTSWKKAPKIIGKPITMLSTISYAVYLLHYGVLAQTMRWVFPIEGLYSLERIFYTATYLILVLVISWLWYRYYEKPMTDIRDAPFVTKFFK